TRRSRRWSSGRSSSSSCHEEIRRQAGMPRVSLGCHRTSAAREQITMTTFRAVALSALFGIVQSGIALADDISTKGMVIKDNTDTTKRSVQVQSKDLSIGLDDAGDPGTNGLSLHVYSATDDFCAALPGGLEWSTKLGKYWKYKNKATKNSAQI